MTTNKKSGIYVHIPFCVRKCNYCAFLSGLSDEAARESYVDSLCREIRIRGANGNDESIGTFDSVFFGGGTPSLLSAEQIDRLLRELRRNLNIENGAEITMESNPATLSSDGLKGYRAAGVNRLSMGVQSMNDAILQRLGRIHTSDDVIRDIKLAREAGYDNINLDLMFAVPGSTPETTLTDLSAICELEPEHVSFYSLQLEEGTGFFDEFERGELEELPDEIDRAMYHAGCDYLVQHGYEHYEISNFCRAGRESRHNLKYWDMSPYLGLGLGASSYIGGRRIVNVSSMDKYLRLVAKGISPIAEAHENSEHDDVSEAVFTGLRKSEGIRYADILGSYDEFWEYYSDVRDEVRRYERDGKLIITREGLRLTEVGIDISNRIMALFV